MFCLGDRVAMRNRRASINDLDLIIDVNEFRHRLGQIKKKETIDNRIKESILIFLETWPKQEKDDDS
jgi:hypothetical protein